MCSGTEAPVVALEQVLGADSVEHCMSCDNGQASQQFIANNFKPQHFFMDIKHIVEESPQRCVMCCAAGKGEFCEGHRQQFDLLVAGFPCPPYSTANPNRFQSQYDFQKHKDVEVFVAVRDFLAKHPKPPRIVVLENVGGVLRKAPGGGTPSDFIMDGKIQQSGQKPRSVGLSKLKMYHVLQLPPQVCRTYGLPLMRQRVFWVLLHVDEFLHSHLHDIDAKLRILNGYRIPCKPVSYFIQDRADVGLLQLLPDTDSDDSSEHCRVPMTKKRRTQPRTWLAKSSRKKADAVRERHGLVRRSAAGGQPWSSSAPEEFLKKFSARECEVIDICFLMVQKEKGSIPDDLVIDVSQSFARRPWISGGRIQSPVCQSKFWHQGQTIDFRSTLALLGWPKTRVKWTAAMTDSDERILTGNMISPPVIGGVFLALAAVLGKRPDQ